MADLGIPSPKAGPLKKAMSAPIAPLPEASSSTKPEIDVSLQEDEKEVLRGQIVEWREGDKKQCNALLEKSVQEVIARQGESNMYFPQLMRAVGVHCWLIGTLLTDI